MSRSGPFRALLLASLVASALACHRIRGPERAESLDGLTLSLLGGTALVVQGRVEDVPARVVFETAQAHSSVTLGCWPSGDAPASPGTVRVPLASGEWREVEEIPLRSARIGEARLGSRTVTLSHGKECVLTLGLDVIGAHRFEVNPVRREVVIGPSRGTSPDGGMGPVESLARHPTKDLWLTTARLTRGEAVVTGPFVFSTGRERSSLALDVGLGGGLTAGVRGSTETDAGALPEALADAPFRLDAVALSESLHVERPAFVVEEAWRDDVAIGVLGADVWGRFHASIDVGSGRIELTRPETFAEVQLTASGIDRRFGAAIWQSIGEEGARLSWTTEGAAPCEFGVTVGAGATGVSVNTPFPPPGLERTHPECADALRRIDVLSPGALATGEHERCEGACFYVHSAERRVTTCRCEPTPFPSEDEERALLELWKRPRPSDGGVPIIPGWADPIPEPEDP